MEQSPLYIRVHPQDNVAIVVNDGGLPEGAVFADGLALRERVPQGHKVALVDLAEGDEVIRYNVVIGYALQDPAEGQLDQRARDPHAGRARAGRPADRDRQAAPSCRRSKATRSRAIATPTARSARATSSRSRRPCSASPTSSQHAVDAHQGRTAAALSECRRCREPRAHLRLRRRDRRARRDGPDPHRAQHQPEPELRRRGDDGEPRLREAAARAPDAAGHDSDRDAARRRRRHRRFGADRTATSSCCRTKRTSASSR